MKKFLLLLLLIAVGWGYYEGSGTGSAIHTQSASAGRSTSAAAEVLDVFKTFAAGILGDTKEPEEEAPVRHAAPAVSKDSEHPVLLEQKEESLQDEVNDVLEFETALESRVDRSQFVPADKIPKLLKQAIVAAEDRRFYEHGAIDLMGIARAAIANYTAGSTVEGGSTISQQLVKNLFLSEERTMTRKLRELVLAVQLERKYTKDEILELYLNTIYFGHGTYGIGEASRTYFGKEPAELTLSECAILAGLPQAPSAYDPIDHPEEATKRMTIVLMLMAREGYITAKEASLAAFNVLLSK